MSSISIIRSLVKADENGQEVGFALHDALLELGLPKMAEHFKDTTLHPIRKGDYCGLTLFLLGERVALNLSLLYKEDISRWQMLTGETK